MRKSMRTLWVVLCCLTVAAGYAQEVVKENGKIIIDASAIRHTKVKKARATDGTNARLVRMMKPISVRQRAMSRCITGLNCLLPDFPLPGLMP